MWIRGRKNIFATIQAGIPANNDSEMIWMHCASLGEFEQGRPLLEHLKLIRPESRILLTFFSASGYEIRKNYEGADYIFYLPMDSKHNAERFLNIVKPTLVLWVKYEYWHYYLTGLQRRNVPLLLVSGIFRRDQVFFKWYGSLHRKMLQCFTQLFVQNGESQALLANIGITKDVVVSGDTRFDRVVKIADSFTAILPVEKFCGDHDVIVAGSTWQEDEEELDHYANTHREIRFIIAPHEIDDEHLREIKKLFHHSILFTDWVQLTDADVSQDAVTAPNVLIINNIGMLSRLYHYATISYIGGGFGEDGVHNVLEAAVFGKPVVFGPVYEKFVEAKELLECGGAFSIENALQLEEVLQVLLKSKHEREKAGESAKTYVISNKGAEEKIVSYILHNY